MFYLALAKVVTVLALTGVVVVDFLGVVLSAVVAGWVTVDIGFSLLLIFFSSSPSDSESTAQTVWVSNASPMNKLLKIRLFNFIISPYLLKV